LHAARKLAGALLPVADSDYQEFIEISFSDSGIGISKQNMGKLFQPFSQIDSSLARKFEGTGLGLAMVKQLAELHGGTVAVASAEGEGARFVVWLPLRTSTQTTIATPHRAVSRKSEPSSPPIKASAHDERMALVVEDDDHAADLVRLLLEADGFTVLRAASAEEALLLAPQQPLRLITLDIQLPGMNGWEFLLRLRENDILARVPVVIIAGEPEKNVALTRGAACVLQKPVSRAELKACLIDLDLDPGPEAHPHGSRRGRRPQGGRVDCRVPAEPGLCGRTGVRRQRSDHPGATAATGPDSARPDDAGRERLRCRRSAPRQSRHGNHPDPGRHGQTDHGAGPGGPQPQPRRAIGIVEKAGFNRSQFVDQVRRMFLPIRRAQPMPRILIIEDNPANMKLACLLMDNVGYAVVCAVDAETGLTLARAEQPDLILMDIQLPGMDGFAATAILKRDPATAAIPVIALTSMAMKKDEEKSQAAGCDAYIAKPLRYQELYAAIDTLLAQGKLRATTESNLLRQVSS
jgi:CheY-like chemotaxis protein